MRPIYKALAGGVLLALLFAFFDPKVRELPLHLARVVFFAGWFYVLMRHAGRRKQGRNEVVLRPQERYVAPAIASLHDPRKAANALHVVAGVAVRDGRVMIARRAPHKALGGKWEFPGGKVERGEAPEAALERELQEEFGLDVQVGDRIGERVHEYPAQTVWLEAYFVELSEGVPVLDSHDEIAWATPQECRSYDMADADWFIIDHLETHGLPCKTT